jgi:DNA polymerase
MFVGEGPGAQEDEKGEPFVGRAGELLDNMIEAMHLRREDVYIGNTVKCRPPGNRDPEKEEMDACAPFLAEQIHIIQPRAIVALGRVAARWFFPDIESIIAERGKWRQWPLAGPMFPMTGGDAQCGPVTLYDVMPTFHPAFLLRNRLGKPAAWRDLQAVMRHVGIPV